MVIRPVERDPAYEADGPLITIGILSYNAERTLRRAVASALAQTWSHREILVVDDGSTDGSWRILNELSDAHPELAAIRHGVNRGVAAARNTILEHARGEFVAFFDDDDESSSVRVEEQRRRIVEYEVDRPRAVVLCYCGRDVAQASGVGRPDLASSGIGHAAPEPSGVIVADYVLGLMKDDGRHSWGKIGSGTLMARTTMLRDLEGFDDRFRRCEEHDLAVRAAMDGAHFISVDAPLITQHLSGESGEPERADLVYRLLLVKKHKPYLKRQKAFVGAWCNMHAWFYRGRRRWWWRVWYIAALACFPWHRSKERLRRSKLLRQLMLLGR